MEWNTIDVEPPKKYRWFAVAQLPRNHSGSDDIHKTDLNGDNSWRKSFGFEKAWLNNGRWYTSSTRINKSVDITPYVTHWAELPDVPILTETFITNKKNSFIYDKESKEEINKLAWDLWEKDQRANPDKVNPHAYAYGFLSALKFLGVLN